MRAGRWVVGVLGVVVIGGLGCDGKRESADAQAQADASASARADASARSGTGTGTGTGESAGTGTGTGESAGTGDAGLVRCKVMASEGGPSAHADATGWLDVAGKANFTVRTLETGRELRFEGPGRVRACGDDVALVAEGSAVGLPGSGEAPGAEQWVATACGVARWASGVHRLVGGRDACRLQLSLGSAHLYVADDVVAEELALDAGAPGDGGAAAPALVLDAGRGKTASWQRFEARRTIGLRLQPRGPLDSPAAVRSALGACERAAQEAATIATDMLGDAGAKNIGALAADSVVARGVARAACAIAAVRIALAGSKPEDQRRLDAAGARWRSPR